MVEVVVRERVVADDDDRCAVVGVAAPAAGVLPDGVVPVAGVDAPAAVVAPGAVTASQPVIATMPVAPAAPAMRRARRAG